MPDNHPAFPGSGPIFQVIDQLKRAFPSEVSSDTLKKWGLAASNEGRLLSVLKFIKVIDENGKKTESAGKTFSIHDNGEFAVAFSKIVKAAYSDLFTTFGEDAWKLDQSKLISYFRHSDQTSSLTGQRQAVVFQTLRSISGYGPKENKQVQNNGKPREKNGIDKKEKSKIKSSSPTNGQPISAGLSTDGKKSDLGLTVRIEVNLPVGGDQETYDRIFKSIRRNLIDG